MADALPPSATDDAWMSAGHQGDPRCFAGPPLMLGCPRPRRQAGHHGTLRAGNSATIRCGRARREQRVHGGELTPRQAGGPLVGLEREHALRTLAPAPVGTVAADGAELAAARPPGRCSRLVQPLFRHPGWKFELARARPGGGWRPGPARPDCRLLAPVPPRALRTGGGTSTTFAWSRVAAGPSATP